ncbi:uncharacterized protein LOC128386733 [Panonychus citri]|uniref:uncharacterized protein LOC128386733 n=1 Tax=Panonychus citri TaxID=50023 RepID=UPI0023074096|nr:uncharacterized protein LOC128386733 [Panonychus citri]
MEQKSASSVRTDYRRVKRFRSFQQADYIENLPESEFISRDSLDSDSIDSIQSDSNPREFSDSESEIFTAENQSLDEKSPSLKEYGQAVMSALLSEVGLNLTEAESTVNLFNNMNKRFSKDPIILPSIRYFHDKRSKKNPVDCYIICPEGHNHGPFSGEPKSFGGFNCNGKECPAKLEQEKYFLHISFRRQLETHLSTISIMDLDNGNLESSITDIHQAAQATKIKSNCSSGVEKLTLSLHSDEVQVGVSSSLKIFPLFISINELQPIFRKSHFFLVSLYVGRTKPSVNNFLSPICNELKDLECNPLFWTDKNSLARKSTFHVIGLIADAPMRAYLRSVRQYNHLNGCDWCLVQATSSNGARVFPNSQNQNSLNRTKSDFIRFKQHIEISNNVSIPGESSFPRFKGLVGISPLLELDSFDIVNGVSVEPMHCIALGILRSLILRGWLGQDNLNLFERNIDKSSFKKCLSERLKTISVPSEFGRAPRDLDHIKYWKSAEFDSFLVYYFIPATKGLLKPKIINHVICLVRIYYLSNRGPIEDSTISELRKLIHEFQQGISIYYGSSFQTYNLHILSHLPDSLLNLGPNGNFSSYALENYMGVLKEKVRRTSNIAPSLVRTFINDFKYFETLEVEISRWNLTENEKKTFGLFSKYHSYSKKDIILKDDTSFNQEKWLRVVKEEIDANLTINDLFFIKTMFSNGTRFSTKRYCVEKKRDDSIIKSTSSEFYQIKQIVRIKGKIFFLCRQFTASGIKIPLTGITGKLMINIDHIFETSHIKDSKIKVLEFHSGLKKSFLIRSSNFSFKYAKNFLVEPFLINF